MIHHVHCPTASTPQSDLVSILNEPLWNLTNGKLRRTFRLGPSHPLLPSLSLPAIPPRVSSPFLRYSRSSPPQFKSNPSPRMATRRLGRTHKSQDGVTPTVNVLYSFSGIIGPGVGLVSTKDLLFFLILAGHFCPNFIYLFTGTGIPTGKCNLRRDRRSPFGRCTTSPSCDLF